MRESGRGCMFFGTTATVFECLLGFVLSEIVSFLSPVFGYRFLDGWRGRDCHTPSRCPFGQRSENQMVIWLDGNE